MHNSIGYILWVGSLSLAVGVLLTGALQKDRFPSRVKHMPDRSSVPSVPSVPVEWIQVNDDAFGLASDGNYQREESFEVLVFNQQLYVGMEADNSLGARLWRSKAGVGLPAGQDDWEEVVADENGFPFGASDALTLSVRDDHIDSLAMFNEVLYVSTANISGTMVYSSTTGDPLTWTRVIPAGFGDPANTNLKDMHVFNGYLCGGTQNATSGAQVWCTHDGATWQQKNVSGFGDAGNRGIWSGAVFRNMLYVGTHHVEGDTETGHLYRTKNLTDTVVWEQVYGGVAGSVRVDILGVLDEYLYIATPTISGIAVRRSLSGDSGSWERVSTVGMDGSAANRGTVVDGATRYREMLYVAVANHDSGVEVWRTGGILQDNRLVDWEQVGTDGLGDSNNVIAQLIVFDDHLCAWTSNYISGQQVRCFYQEPPLPVLQIYLPLVRMR